MTFVMSLPLDEGLKLIAKAREKEEEQRAWEMWLTQLPYMTKDNFVSFDDYYRRLRAPEINVKVVPAEEILSDVAKIRAAAGRPPQ